MEKEQLLLESGADVGSDVERMRILKRQLDTFEAKFADEMHMKESAQEERLVAQEKVSGMGVARVASGRFYCWGWRLCVDRCADGPHREVDDAFEARSRCPGESCGSHQARTKRTSGAEVAEYRAVETKQRA